MKRQNELKAEAIRREQSERRAKEEAALRQRQDSKKREEKAQADSINLENEAREKEVSSSPNTSIS